jgi:galactan 5-O-arabinofuranosyltransferase
MPDSTVQAHFSAMETEPAPDTPDEPAAADRARRTRLRQFGTSTATITVVTWLIATPLAFVIPRVLDLDPFSEQGAFVPLAIGGSLLAVMTAFAWRRKAGELVPAISAGLFAAWVALAFRVALTGTPFGTTGLQGDRVRMAAAATKYTVTPWPVDSFIEGLPSEYPPLFPWLVGRTSLIVGVPAWRLLAFFEVGLLSFAVLAAFLLWRRLVPAAVALPLSAIGLFVYGDPRKAFAVITLLIFIPWLISAFTDVPRGRMHWLPAGIIGGLIMLTYIGWFPFGAVGVLAIVVASWRRVSDRAHYVRHVLQVGAVSIVLASPYLVPWLSASLTKGGQAVSDLWMAGDISTNGFPFLKPTLIGAVQLIGLAGLVWYRKRAWWAWPVLYLVLGSYLYWLIFGIRFMLSRHTSLFYYVPLLTGAALLSAGVLTIATAGPALARRLKVVPPYRFGAAVLAVAMLWIGFDYWQDWRPAASLSTHNDYTRWAHLEPLPNCTYPKYAPKDGRIDCYPADRIKAEVERVRGVGARPYTLASEERLFAYLPWPGFMGVDRTAASTLARWDDRQDEVIRLSDITDPAEFATATANTRFGPIDVMVMYKRDAQTWYASERQFHPGQFDTSVWDVVDLAPQSVVLAIRRTS